MSFVARVFVLFILLGLVPCTKADWLGEAVPQLASPIQFPALPAQTAPDQPVTKLGANQLYVITSDVPCYVLASPNGLVTIIEEAGPLRIRGKFVDGTKTETRTYKQKQIFIVEATGSGTVELLVIVVGKTKAEDVLRKTLVVESSDDPIPVPVQDEFTKALQVAFVQDGKPGIILPVLIDFYSTARSPTGIIFDKKLKSREDIHTVMHTAIESRLPNQLTHVRRAIADEMNRVLGTKDAPLTQETRDAIAAQFVRIETALKGVK